MTSLRFNPFRLFDLRELFRRRNEVTMRIGGGAVERARSHVADRLHFSASAREAVAGGGRMVATVTLHARDVDGRAVLVEMSPDVACLVLDDLASRVAWCLVNANGDRLPDVEALNAARTALGKHCDEAHGGVCTPLACLACSQGTATVDALERGEVRP